MPIKFPIIIFTITANFVFGAHNANTALYNAINETAKTTFKDPLNWTTCHRLENIDIFLSIEPQLSPPNWKFSSYQIYKETSQESIVIHTASSQEIGHLLSIDCVKEYPYKCKVGIDLYNDTDNAFFYRGIVALILLDLKRHHKFISFGLANLQLEPEIDNYFTKRKGILTTIEWTWDRIRNFGLHYAKKLNIPTENYRIPIIPSDHSIITAIIDESLEHYNLLQHVSDECANKYISQFLNEENFNKITY